MLFILSEIACISSSSEDEEAYSVITSTTLPVLFLDDPKSDFPALSVEELEHADRPAEVLGHVGHADRPVEALEHVEDFTFRTPCFAPALHSMLIFRSPLYAHSHLVKLEHLDPAIPIAAIPALTTLTASFPA